MASKKPVTFLEPACPRAGLGSNQPDVFRASAPGWRLVCAPLLDLISLPNRQEVPPVRFCHCMLHMCMAGLDLDCLWPVVSVSCRLLQHKERWLLIPCLAPPKRADASTAYLHFPSKVNCSSVCCSSAISFRPLLGGVDAV